MADARAIGRGGIFVHIHLNDAHLAGVFPSEFINDGPLPHGLRGRAKRLKKSNSTGRSDLRTTLSKVASVTCSAITFSLRCFLAHGAKSAVRRSEPGNFGGAFVLSEVDINVPPVKPISQNRNRTTTISGVFDSSIGGTPSPAGCPALLRTRARRLQHIVGQGLAQRNGLHAPRS